jgi:hypothetical protein
MIDVSEKYLNLLDELMQKIGESDLYHNFLDTEEESDYRVFCDAFEPFIDAIHKQVAADEPLQLVAFEKLLLHPELQNLFTPRILGYAILRGEVNDQIRYKRPQAHFKEILVSICESSNLDFLRRRIGQAVQIGFALSSDIWITDLINQFQNKRVKQFLQAQKNEKYRDLAERQKGYHNFKKQLSHENYLSAAMPTTVSELKVLFSEVMIFLEYRAKNSDLPLESVVPAIEEMLNNPAFNGSKETDQLLTLYLNYFPQTAESVSIWGSYLNQRRQDPGFSDNYLNYMIEGEQSRDLITIPGQSDLITAQLDATIKDDILDLYQLLVDVQTYGFVHPDAIEMIRAFYIKHGGVAPVSSYLRNMIARSFVMFVSQLESTDYHAYMDIYKVMHTYIGVFDNEAFNKSLKDASIGFMKRLVPTFKDRKAKDYLELRRFVGVAFKESRFMNDKEIVEFFKKHRD